MTAPRFLPVAAGAHWISDVFGSRAGAHRGLDLAANDGTRIYAAQAGVVAHIGFAGGFGQWIVIDHPAEHGAGTTVYGHMWDAFAVPGMRLGAWVEAGQHIGYVGSNGGSTGPHLHFEVHPTVWRAGSQIDPAPWLAGALDPGAPPPAPAPAPAPRPAGFLPDLTSDERAAVWRGFAQWAEPHRGA